MICEYVGTAETEAAALAMLEADPATLYGLATTLTGSDAKIIAQAATTDDYTSTYGQVGDLV